MNTTPAEQPNMRRFLFKSLFILLFLQLFTSAALALNLGDCTDTYAAEEFTSCQGYFMCASGCTDSADVPNGCGPGASWNFTKVENQDRIQIGTCGTYVSHACPRCPGLIFCARGLRYQDPGCVLSCGPGDYYLAYYLSGYCI